MDAGDAHRSFLREAWQARVFFRGEVGRSCDTLFNAAFYRIGSEVGLPGSVSDRIGPEMRRLRRRLRRDLNEDDVRALIARLLLEFHAGHL